MLPDLRASDPARRGRLLTAAALLASVFAGAALGLLDPSVEAFLLVGIAFAALGPLALRLLRRRADLFEPLTIASLALAVMFVARPAALVATEGPKAFKGYEITGQIRETLLIALVAVVAFHLGYAAPWAARLAARLPTAPAAWAIDTTTLYSIGLAVVGTLLFAAFLLQAGGLHVFLLMLQGRSAAGESWFRNSTAYLYGGPLLFWPASLLLFAIGIAQRRRALVGLSIVVLLPAALFAGWSGARIALLPLLLAPWVYGYLARGRRPSMPVLLVAGYLLFTVGIAYFRDTRVAGQDIDRVAALQHAITHPGYEAEALVLNGIDNDMFESLAIETLVVPEVIRADPVDFAKRFFAKPIPSILWRGKPLDPDEHLNDLMFPKEATRASSSTGIVGSFYLAGTLPGVVVGMALLGLALRVPWEYWRRFPHASSSMLVLAATLMFIPMALRGGLSDFPPRTLFGLVPLLVAVKLCGSGLVRREPG